jgi:molybdopterin synthase catalytic subunit
VLFFGICREIVGEEISLTLPRGSNITAAFQHLTQDYPGLAVFQQRLLFAVNENYAKPDQVLQAEDVLAILPPVSGGNADIIELTTQPINSRQLAQRLLQPAAGAIVTFDGITRGQNGEREVLYLEYEAYEPMALKVMGQIAAEAHQQWPILQLALVHRLGQVAVSETSVAIVVLTAHRKAAFAANEFLINRLKEIVPIWKREYFTDGAVWVDPQLITK